MSNAIGHLHFFRGNIHSFSQLLALAGHVGNNIKAAKFGDYFLKSTIIGWYSNILHAIISNLKKLQGLALYHDKQKAKFCIAVSIHGKDRQFEQRYKADKNKSASRSSPSEFVLLYPSKKPNNAEMGGWEGVFEMDLTM